MSHQDRRPSVPGIPLIVAALPLAAVAAAVLPACSSPPASGAGTRATVVDTVRVDAAGDASRSFDGVVRPRRDIALSFKRGGRITALSVEIGDHVRAGQVIARIGAAEAESALRQARAELAAATADASQARDAADRATGLDAAGALAAVEVRQRALTARAAEARRTAAAATVSRAGVSVADGVLLAPEDGVVTERAVDPGTVVDAGTPIVRLAGGGREVEVQLPETVQVSRGVMADVAYPHDGHAPGEARLRSLAPAGDRTLRLRTARFTLLGAARDVPFNTSVTLTLRLPDAGGTARAPLTSIAGRGGNTYVWSLAADGRTIRRTPVHIVSYSGSDALLWGVHDGQRLVATATDTLHDGQTVVDAGLGTGSH